MMVAKEDLRRRRERKKSRMRELPEHREGTIEVQGTRCLR